MSYSEEAFLFDSGALKLYGIWCAPEGPPRSALLYCHPFGEEKKCAHRTVVETARALAAQGVASLRFDLGGCGDSQGNFADAAFSGWIDDVAAAWDEIGRRAPEAPRALLGLRMGGALAAIACARLANVNALLLWQPLIDGEEEITREVRRVLVQQMFVTGRADGRREELVTALREGAIELDGFPVSSTLYEDVSEFKLKNTRLAFPKRSALIQFGRPQRDIDRFIAVEALQGGLVDLPPIWRRIDFMPDAETGDLLAREGVLRWI
jgi:exosortase A-associated hydrolase 2